MRRVILCALALVGCKDFDSAYNDCVKAHDCLLPDGGFGGGGDGTGGGGPGGGGAMGGGTGGGSGGGGSMPVGGGGGGSGGGVGGGGGSYFDGGLCPAVRVTSHGTHSCVLYDGGAAACWGSNSSRESGTQSFENPVVPTVLPRAYPLTVLSEGKYFTCAVTAGNAIFCWGNDSQQQLGSDAGSLSVFDSYALAPVYTANRLATADSFTCASSSSPLRCWGDSYGLGQDVPVGANVLELAGGTNHLCMLEMGGAVQCIGGNAFSQLGDGTSADSYSQPVNALGSGYSLLAAGGDTTCATTNSGADLYCWGDCSHGKCANGSFGAQLTPKRAQFDGGVLDVAIGNTHTCIISAQHDIWCWGGNANGQLGIGAMVVDAGTPVRVPGGAQATSISAGDLFTCATFSDGGLSCWGDNSVDQLGSPSGGAGTGQTSPTPVPCP